MENILNKIKEKQDLSFLEKLQDEKIEVYAFGGLLRDIYLNREWDDVDLRIVISEPREVREQILEAALSDYNLEGKTVIENLNLTVYRFLPDDSSSREPIDLSLVSSLEDNLPDFNINSLFYNLKNETLLDNYSGITGLNSQQLSTVKTPLIHFKEEPHMIFRAIKFSCQIDFEIESETLDAIKELSSEIQNTFNFIKNKKEGIFVELFLGNIFKGLKSNPIKYFNLLNITGLFKEFLIFSKLDNKELKYVSIEPKDLGSYETNLSYLFSEITNIITEDDREAVFKKIIEDLAISTNKEYSDFNIDPTKLIYLK